MFMVEQLLLDIKDEKKYMINILKQSLKPVVIYGGGCKAERVAKFLNDNGITISAFFVDDEFFIPNKTINGVKVLSLQELNSKYKEYNVVIGFCNYEKAKKIIESGIFNSKGIVVYFDDIENIEYSYFRSNLQKFQETYDMLEDDLSKKIYIAFLKGRLSGNPGELISYCSEPQYFCDLININSNEVYVDCGAYEGDTICQFNKLTNGIYKKIYAFEPEKDSYFNLCKNTLYMHDIELINKGVWKEDTILKFKIDGTSSNVCENGEIEISVTSIDDTVGDDIVTFIKMDVEGSELMALKGAENTIKRCMPKLAICVYHKKEDIITIPQYISQFNSMHKKYKLYLRHHSLSSYETVLYAIPTEI